MLRDEVVPQLRTRANFAELYFQQDGATHYALLVRNHLDSIFPLHWIGRRCSTDWPPRSTELTTMDFFFGGVVKNKLYERKLQRVDKIKKFITDAFMDIQTASCVELCVKAFRTGWMHVVKLMEDISST
jgi:hypothetical protein